MAVALTVAVVDTAAAAAMSCGVSLPRIHFVTFSFLAGAKTLSSLQRCVSPMRELHLPSLPLLPE